jgi:imidazole glycerol-phosphate synthase subunit HisH
VKRVAVLDHGMGNLRSVAKALEAAGAAATVTNVPAEIERTDALCVPGQGIFGRCVQNLAETGNDELVASWIGSDRPYLGICLGMQILFDRSDENDAKGLGIFPGDVRRLPPILTVPHIGWNEVGDTHYYFDHSYGVHPADESIVAGWCEHGERFAAVVKTRSVFAVQFHPEKSGTAGIDLLKGWIR